MDKIQRKKLHLHQILFVDESNLECKLHPVNKYQWRFYVDPTMHSRYLSKDDGGVLPPWAKRTNPKFKPQAAVCSKILVGDYTEIPDR